MPRKCVAITGASGRIGTSLLAELAGRCEVRGIDRVAPAGALDHRLVDIMDLPALAGSLAGIDAVIHLAGHDIDAAVADAEFIRVNALGTFNVLTAAEAAGVRRVIVCSSIAATGLNEGRTDHPPCYLPVDEDHPGAPLGAYGLSKELVERIAARFVRAGLEVIVLRPMLVMFPLFFPLVEERLAAPASRWLSYYVTPEDTARAFRLALEARHVRSGTFFVTATDTCREEPTLQWLERAWGHLPEIRRPELYRATPRAAVFDPGRARDILGFEATSDWLALRQETV